MAAFDRWLIRYWVAVAIGFALTAMVYGTELGYVLLVDFVDIQIAFGGAKQYAFVSVFGMVYALAFAALVDRKESMLDD